VRRPTRGLGVGGLSPQSLADRPRVRREREHPFQRPSPPRLPPVAGYYCAIFFLGIVQKREADWRTSKAHIMAARTICATQPWFFEKGVRQERRLAAKGR